jgi:hypothetical protein
MSAGRHAKPRPPRSDTPLLIVVMLLAAAVAVTPFAVDGLDALRGAVVALAVLGVIVAFAIRGHGRYQAAALSQEVKQRGHEVRLLRLELNRVATIQHELADEVVRLREELADFVLPIPVAPDPIYPSLHLPLVRAAFANELPPVTRVPEPKRITESPNVAVVADSGSDAAPPRQLLDLTASEIAGLRRVSSA